MMPTALTLAAALLLELVRLAVAYEYLNPTVYGRFYLMLGDITHGIKCPTKFFNSAENKAWVNYNRFAKHLKLNYLESLLNLVLS